MQQQVTSISIDVLCRFMRICAGTKGTTKVTVRCAGLGWACGWAGSGGRAGSPLAVAEVLAQWLEAHRR